LRSRALTRAVFQGIWKVAPTAELARLLTRQVLSPMLDPVVRAKIQMTKSNADLQVHIPPEHLIKEVRAVACCSADSLSSVARTTGRHA